MRALRTSSPRISRSIASIPRFSQLAARWCLCFAQPTGYATGHATARDRPRRPRVVGARRGLGRRGPARRDRRPDRRPRDAGGAAAGGGGRPAGRPPGALLSAGVAAPAGSAAAALLEPHQRALRLAAAAV